MTFSKHTLIAIVLGALGVAVLLVYLLLFRNLQEAQEQRLDLEVQLTSIQEAAAGKESLQPQILTHEAELAAQQAALDAAQLQLPSSINTIDVLAEIVTVAAIHRVSLRQIQALEPRDASVEGFSYRVQSYRAAAVGQLEALNAFLEALEAGPAISLSLPEAQLRLLPTPTSQPTQTAPQNPAIYEATFILEIYTRLLPDGVSDESTPQPLMEPEARVEQIKQLLTQAEVEENWENAISLMLVLRQLQPEAVADNERLALFYVRAGHQQLDAGRYQEADRSFRAALTWQANHPEALLGLTKLTLLTPTPTLPPTETPTPKPTPTATPTATPRPFPYYVAHLGFSANSRYPALGCGWFGVYGRVLDASNYPVADVTVKIWGADWDGYAVTTLANGEYEFYLDNRPKKELWYVQLFSGAKAISERASVESREDCSAALIQLDWKRGN